MHVFRVMAFLKRLGICALQSSAPIAAGLLFLISEVYRARPNLLVMMTCGETLVPHKVHRESKPKGKQGDNDNDEEGEDDSSNHQLGNFEASKREPAFAVTGTPALWEASLLRNHFHPSVRSFSSSVLEAPHCITFAGDPTTEFSLSAFLNRFAYKNPKKQHSDKIRRPQAIGEEPLNTTSFLRSSLADIAPDKIFFHKFFGEKEKLRMEGKSRDRSKRKQLDSDDEGDNESVGSDDEVNFDEKAIDKFATKLAEDMMRDNDDLVDIDDDFSDSGDSEGDSVGDSDGGEDFDMGGSDEESESGAVDFEDFKKEKSKKDAAKGGKAKTKADKSKDEYELTAYGDDDEDEDADGMDSMASDVEDDSDMGSDIGDDDEEEDDLALAFSDEMPSSRKQQDLNGKKKGKGKKPAGDMSDFASADDYEDAMEEIVGRYSGVQTDSATSSISSNVSGVTKKGGSKRKNVGGGGGGGGAVLGDRSDTKGSLSVSNGKSKKNRLR
jgi:ribosome biogenesis protein MAK21